MRRHGFIAAAAALVIALVALAGCGGGGGSSSKKGSQPSRGPLITIGTKNFPEQFILGELYRQALEANGFRVRLKSDIGSSEIVDRALTAGSLDMYPEYIGVALSELAGNTARPSSRGDAYRQAKAFEEGRGFTLLAMTPFSDQNALAVLPAYAKRNRLRSIGDLAKVPGMVDIAAPPEFRTRFEGLVGLRRLYGLTRVQRDAAQDRRPVRGARQEAGERRERVHHRRPAREGPLRAAERPAQPVHLPERRAGDPQDLLRKNPALATAIDSVSSKLTTRAMRAMNASVSQRGEQPAAVAERFLRQVGLMNGARAEQGAGPFRPPM